MADVAGTVIGVISLSIQLFDKLSKYTNGVKDANTKAEQILIEMDDLADLLEQLETVTNKITMNNSTALAKRGICQCARAIDMVKAKLGDNNLPTSRPWAKFRKTVRRLAYPFEEADIKYWKDVLAYRQGELILRRPVFLTYVKLHAHARGCPFWSKQSLQTNLTFGLILCCLTLGLKWRLLLAVSVGTRSLSAVPSLTIHRVVGPSSSPAFMSVASAVASPINKDTVPALFRDLQNIFGTRRASPHDRLPNGQTLLHYLCSGLGQRVWILDKRQLHHYRSLLKVILSFVGCRNASEIDDMGNTCVDLLLRATDPVDQTWNTLVSDLLETGLQISTNCHPNGSFESYGSWVEIPFAGFPNPFFSSTEATDIFLIRSEPQLRHYLQELQHRNCIAPGGSQRLYKMATRMGWVYGCEAMLDSGLGYIPELVEGARARNPISEPLLFDAIESRSTQMVSFWLHIRDKVDPEHLPYIGDLEAAFVHASEIFQLQDIAELLLSHLIERRKQFFQLAVASNILDVGNFTDAGILDAHATCVARALAEQCIEVPPAVWPSRNSVYNIKQLYQEQPPVYDATI
ncbi:hypothetical protein CC86DRAFT_423034 [Ophiobolus disseminans]|uniref:Fungal N-terminal domain-containing protein n=1 Tax=Ophiobolus disseminans TaxID=1469910 RepID=A0A6A6ZQB0_9PLEO|nr:hypothetical protein CC86DRAFT_423034 [Ophiobolus disseminans]